VSKSSANLQNLRDLSDEELSNQLASTRDELFRLQLGQYTNQVTSTAALMTKRRDIARILTILNGRKLGNEKQAGAAASAGGASASTEAAPAKKTRKAKAKS
jgi:large subunit ribosomal protein L29